MLHLGSDQNGQGRAQIKMAWAMIYPSHARSDSIVSAALELLHSLTQVSAQCLRQETRLMASYHAFVLLHVLASSLSLVDSPERPLLTCGLITHPSQSPFHLQ